MTVEFNIWSPYKVIDQLTGVQAGSTLPKTTFLQSLFGDVGTTEENSIDMDIEFNTRNMMGEYVAPDGEAKEYRLEGFGHRTYGFAYQKGVVTNNLSPNFARRIGEVIGSGGDPNRIDEFKRLQAVNLDAMKNLRELNARDVLFYGSHTATGERHPTIKFDFPKVEATTSAQYKGSSAKSWSKVDLTTLNHNGGVGKAVWSDSGSNGGTVLVDCHGDLLWWEKHARDRHYGVNSIIMSADTYATYENNIQAVRKDGYDLTKNVRAEDRIFEQLSPTLTTFKGLDLVRTVRLNGRDYPVYVYNGTYFDPITGVESSFVPDGYVLFVPLPDNQVIRFGRIMHFMAKWQAMPIWIQEIMNQETGAFKQIFHSSIFMGVKNPDAVMSIKVK